ncbi:PREDICTED: uncharacterized protein LOC106819911 isoform X2 [Priapulus caudatus]|uniref:Uncharacterized protein LOC106819911 isoform X2 n=1 Tax=Priapulus caudatus TaxID=37621 RepID=A0ABM1F6A7_PRICU|nr:PREDICTED: uncharacterized protein LOC106819911 isoform X2 [Priapulus caudatus]
MLESSQPAQPVAAAASQERAPSSSKCGDSSQAPGNKDGSVATRSRSPQLSQKLMLVPDTMDEEENEDECIPPTSDSYGDSVELVPCTPTDNDSGSHSLHDDTDKGAAAESMQTSSDSQAHCVWQRSKAVSFQEWQPTLSSSTSSERSSAKEERGNEKAVSTNVEAVKIASDVNQQWPLDVKLAGVVEEGHEVSQSEDWQLQLSPTQRVSKHASLFAASDASRLCKSVSQPTVSSLATEHEQMLTDAAIADPLCVQEKREGSDASMSVDVQHISQQPDSESIFQPLTHTGLLLESQHGRKEETRGEAVLFRDERSGVTEEGGQREEGATPILRIEDVDSEFQQGNGHDAPLFQLTTPDFVEKMLQNRNEDPVKASPSKASSSFFKVKEGKSTPQKNKEDPFAIRGDSEMKSKTRRPPRALAFGDKRGEESDCTELGKLAEKATVETSAPSLGASPVRLSPHLAKPVAEEDTQPGPSSQRRPSIIVTSPRTAVKPVRTSPRRKSLAAGDIAGGTADLGAARSSERGSGRVTLDDSGRRLSFTSLAEPAASKAARGEDVMPLPRQPSSAVSCPLVTKRKKASSRRISQAHMQAQSLVKRARREVVRGLASDRGGVALPTQARRTFRFTRTRKCTSATKKTSVVGDTSEEGPVPAERVKRGAALPGTHGSRAVVVNDVESGATSTTGEDVNLHAAIVHSTTPAVRRTVSKQKFPAGPGSKQMVKRVLVKTYVRITTVTTEELVGDGKVVERTEVEEQAPTSTVNEYSEPFNSPSLSRVSSITSGSLADVSSFSTKSLSLSDLDRIHGTSGSSCERHLLGGETPFGSTPVATFRRSVAPHDEAVLAGATPEFKRPIRLSSRLSVPMFQPATSSTQDAEEEAAHPGSFPAGIGVPDRAGGSRRDGPRVIEERVEDGEKRERGRTPERERSFSAPLFSTSTESLGSKSEKSGGHTSASLPASLLLCAGSDAPRGGGAVTADKSTCTSDDDFAYFRASGVPAIRDASTDTSLDARLRHDDVTLLLDTTDARGSDGSRKVGSGSARKEDSGSARKEDSGSARKEDSGSVRKVGSGSLRKEDSGSSQKSRSSSSRKRAASSSKRGRQQKTRPREKEEEEREGGDIDAASSSSHPSPIPPELAVRTDAALDRKPMQRAAMTESDVVTSTQPQRPSDDGGGARVMARWRDRHFYPGRVAETTSDGRLSVVFADGDVRLMRRSEVISCRLLPEGQRLKALAEDGYYYKGTVVGHFGRGDDAGYEIDVVGRSVQRYSWDKVMLSTEQAQAYLDDDCGATTSSGTLPPFDINLGNLLHGKRSCRGRQAGMDVSVSESRSLKASAVKTKPASSSKKGVKRKAGGGETSGSDCNPAPQKLVILQQEIVLTPKNSSTPTLGSEIRSTGGSKHAPSPVPQSPRRTPRRARAAHALQFVEEAGPIFAKGSTLFAGMTFILTKADPSGSVLAEDEKEGTSATSTDCSSIEATPRVTVDFNKDHITKQIKAGGGKIFKKFEQNQATAENFYLIADTFCRTAKYLQALACSIPCVSHRWIHDSCCFNQLQDYRGYILPAGQNILTGKPVEWQARGPVLAGLRIMILSVNSMFKELWSPVLVAAGGEVVGELYALHPDAPNPVDVVMADQIDNVTQSVGQLSIPVVTSEWIIQCLVNGFRIDCNAHSKFRLDLV